MSESRITRSMKCERKKAATARKIDSSIMNNKQGIKSKSQIPSSKRDKKKLSEFQCSVITKNNAQEKNGNVIAGIHVKTKTLPTQQEKKLVSSRKRGRRHTVSCAHLCSGGRKSDLINCDKSKKKHKKCIKSHPQNVRGKNVPIDDPIALTTPNSKLLYSMSRSTAHVQQKKSSSDTEKIPGKGTLKRKRWLICKLNKLNKYEDDLYESRQFETFEDTLHRKKKEDSLTSFPTPKLPYILSPVALKKTPIYKDLYSPNEYKMLRKAALEYQYARNQWIASAKKKQASERKKGTKIIKKKRLDFSILNTNLPTEEEQTNNSFNDNETSCLSNASNL